MYELRGHHLFCLLGYRGMGYSEEYAKNMTSLHKTLRENPQTLIKIVEGPDQLCEKFPSSGKYHCQDQNIYERDATILKRLGIHLGDVLAWETIEDRVLKHVKPSDIGEICQTCSWRSYGVCEEGIANIHNGKGLSEVK